MKKIRTAFGQFISGTCANAKKYNGERKNEKGMRSNCIVDVFIISYPGYRENGGRL